MSHILVATVPVSLPQKGQLFDAIIANLDPGERASGSGAGWFVLELVGATISSGFWAVSMVLSFESCGSFPVNLEEVDFLTFMSFSFSTFEMESFICLFRYPRSRDDPV